ncbi:peptidoglycan-binding protein [Thiomicrorhabdus sp. Milos-T2]|uniref:peptidoglycan-binding domain-containing protein n=1 Tax=Thiomicrorhabdus sp. Milos-T2 TaxID=90814 RepID=UPI0004946575|nr:peptidoglycan-binding domain-containing protein [Thiomicrorhabdus sp. Milos-T2]
MHLKKITTVIVLGTVLNGCSSSQISSDSDSNSKQFSQAEVDLMIEQARVDEQQRINSELNRQAQQKRIFKRLLAEKNGTKVSSKSTEVDKPTMHSEIHKIIPTSRKPVLYKKMDGVSYYRCAANSLVPIKDIDGKFIYHPNKRELTATLCKANRDKKTMLALQTALYNQGYLVSDSLTKDQLIDGIWGETTLVAVKKYQQDHGLLFGQLSIQTLEHIGLFREDKIVDDMLGVKQIKVVKQEPIDESEIASAQFSDEENVKVSHKEVATSETPDEVKEVAENVNALVKDKKQRQDKNPSQILEAANSVEKTNNKNEIEIARIVPKSRKPVLYKNLEGVNYYRCAANALVPINNGSEGWRYSKGKKELSATLCKKSRDVATMTALQYELYDKGYLKSDSLTQDQLIDGVWGETTLVALKDYQQKNGLLYGQLTIESLENIGVFEADSKRIKQVSQNLVNSKPQEKKQTQEADEIKETEATKPLSVKKASPLLETENEVGNEVVSEAVAESTTKSKTESNDVFNPIILKGINENSFNVTDIPKTSHYVVYGYVKGEKVWRCRARADIPKKLDNGKLVYNGLKEFRATLCKASRSADIIKSLQLSLRDKGYLKPNPPLDLVVIDGIWGINTLSAVKAYQKENGLAYGQLTLEVLQHLGVFKKE